jgi:hypothetical protein
MAIHPLNSKPLFQSLPKPYTGYAFNSHTIPLLSSSKTIENAIYKHVMHIPGHAKIVVGKLNN